MHRLRTIRCYLPDVPSPAGAPNTGPWDRSYRTARPSWVYIRMKRGGQNYPLAHTPLVQLPPLTQCVNRLRGALPGRHRVMPRTHAQLLPPPSEPRLRLDFLGL